MRLRCRSLGVSGLDLPVPILIWLTVVALVTLLTLAAGLLGILALLDTSAPNELGQLILGLPGDAAAAEVYDRLALRHLPPLRGLLRRALRTDLVTLFVAGLLALPLVVSVGFDIACGALRRRLPEHHDP